MRFLPLLSFLLPTAFSAALNPAHYPSNQAPPPLPPPYPHPSPPPYPHPPPPPTPPNPYPGTPLSPTVHLDYATYTGALLPSSPGSPFPVLQFLGLRFAAPPLGALRWRAPRDPLHEALPQSAKDFQPTCLGYFGPGLSNSTDEDCLFLDVFAPADATTASRLPVWFFIQGGGYAGDTDQNFNGSEVVRRAKAMDGRGMVFVQINYRVGVFGFLAGEKVRENGDGEVNVGLLDQRKALQWVQKYIHLFGGDPDHVVIHGDSAGAGSVAYHLTAYGGRDDGLFVGAIAESPFWPTHRTIPELDFQFWRFAANVSCADPPGGDVMACLRSKDTVTLQAADTVSTFPGASGPAEWWFLPCVDGDFSTDYLYNLFSQGKVVRVPLIVGDDTDEGTGFSPNAATSKDFLDFIQDNYPRLSPSDLERINQTYPENGFGDFIMHAPYFPATETAYGESTFICPGIEMTDSLTLYNSPAKTWNYRYNVQDSQYTSLGLGVPHVSEKPAIFGPGNAGACDNCSYLSYNAPIVPIVMDYWLSFMLTLNPNSYKSSTAPVWENWAHGRGGWGGGQGAQSKPQRLKIELGDTVMENVPTDQLQRCALWKSLADVTEQ